MESIFAFFPVIIIFLAVAARFLNFIKSMMEDQDFKPVDEDIPYEEAGTENGQKQESLVTEETEGEQVIEEEKKVERERETERRNRKRKARKKKQTARKKEESDKKREKKKRMQEKIKQGIIFKEIIDKPRAKRPYKPPYLR